MFGLLAQPSVVPQQQNSMGSLHNIDFGVFWACWGGSGKEPGSGNRFRETGVRTRCIVPGSNGCEPEVSKVSVFDAFRAVRFCSRGLDGTGSGTGFPEPEVLRRFGPRFRKLLCTSKVYSCTLKVHFCALKVYFCALKVYWCTLVVYFCTLGVYFCTLKVYRCTLKI